MITTQFSLRFSGLTRIVRALENPQGKLLSALIACERDYATFVVRRFDLYSKGGGDWKPNARRTPGKRILVDTRLMRLGLQGGIKRRRLITSGAWLRIEMGFENESTHPPSGLTIADIATIHHAGLGRVPSRPILVQPDSATKQRIAGRIISALKDTR